MIYTVGDKYTMSTKCQSHKDIKTAIVHKCVTGAIALMLCAVSITMMA